ncbi:two-component sensor histidine kinase [Cellulomonas sp. JZ18]|uniref:sensor histidine kinase n=1 Tax=Cellulomonas sp. JZ18 TaxID=2654191 RepID=UPI0012D45FA4|nr:histidine kinase [Cellulomonas sp. JZ18]QGQ19834.1 two-component sensor histidine kinase [Cellulomonas sp. JZ18]
MTTAPLPAPLPAAPPVAADAVAGDAPVRGALTELQARRLGPVRRYFAQHPRAMDAVVVVVYALPGLLLATAASDTAIRREDVGDGRIAVILAVMLGGFVAGAVALNWRRTRPVTVAGTLAGLVALSYALTGSPGTLDLALTLAVYAVAANRPPRVTWATVGIAYLVVAGSTLAWQDDDLVEVDAAVTAPAPAGDPATADVDVLAVAPTPLDDGASMPARVFSASAELAVLLIATSIGTSVRNRRLHVAELVERTNALARERDQQAQIAQAAERSRIAREMHDVVAHSITVMIALSDGANIALTRSPDAARTALGELSSTGRSALAEMRRVLGVLDDDGAPMTPQPGSHDLVALVERFRTAGLPVDARGLTTALPDEATLQIAVHRVVAEALTNALRHAPGTPRVQLCLTRTETAVVVEVLDDGPRGPVPDAGGAGRGLIGMRERAAVYGGAVEAGPRPEGGWRVRVTLPWTTTTEDA